MNLQQVDTPLKGGLNTPMLASNFDGATPRKQVQQTPNMMIATPYRTPGPEGQGIILQLSLDMLVWSIDQIFKIQEAKYHLWYKLFDFNEHSH